MKDYRFDKRSQKQFKKDIKECSQIESDLMEQYVKWLNNGNGGHPAGSYSFSHNGVDNSGEFIKDGRKVNCDADFMLHTQGGRDKRIEIKFSRKETSQLHYKVAQLESYIKQDLCLVTFIIESNKFFIMTPKDMKELLKNGYRTKFWHKLCVRLYTNKIDWKFL